MRSDTVLWRCIGLAALVVCSINVLVLLNGQASSKVTQDQANGLQNGRSPTSMPMVNQGNVLPNGLYKTMFNNIVSQQTRDVAASKVPEAISGNQTVAYAIEKPVWLKVVHMGEFMEPHRALYLGKRRGEKGFLTIGIPTVYRSKGSYLMETLNGLVTNLSPTGRGEVTMVVFVADFSQSYRDTVIEDVKKRFPKEIEDGVVQVIVAPKEFYPDMRNLPLMYGDKADRVQWRSKQALDYSFLYYYCAGLGRYYIQLEDDVLVEKGYLEAIKSFIGEKDDGWSTLEFGARGFIGMLYRGEHLLALARFSRMYFWTMPIDWIFRVYNDIFLNGSSDRYIRKPPIFKHIGAFSSLEGQFRKLEDMGDDSGKEEAMPRLFQKKPNPEATLSTTIEQFVVPHAIDHPYRDKGFFWGKTVRAGDTIDILLADAVRLSRIVFASGSRMYPQDSLSATELLLSPEVQGRCVSFRTVGSFTDTPVLDVAIAEDIDFPVKCIRLLIKDVRVDHHGHTRWLLISEIALIPRS